MVFLIALLCGLAAGILLGGSVSNLRHARYKGETVLLVALAAQAAAPLLAGSLSEEVTWTYYVWLSSFALVALVALANRRQLGSLAIAAGATMNMLVIALNRGMPVSSHAMTAAGYTGEPSSAFYGAEALLHHVSNADTRLMVLADVMPIPGPPAVQSVVSVGDLLLAVGLVAFISAAMLGSPGQCGHDRRQPREAYRSMRTV